MLLGRVGNCKEMEVLVDCLTFRFLSTLSDGVGISSNTLGRADIHADRLALIDWLTLDIGK